MIDDFENYIKIGKAKRKTPDTDEATISFLKKYYATEFTDYQISQFDRFRELRNNFVYKAEPILINDAKKCIEFSKKIINQIKEINHEQK